MTEELWIEENISDDDVTIFVSVVETTDTITGDTVFLAMTDDTSQFFGKGMDAETAIVNLEAQMFEVDEFDNTPWELKLAS